MEMKKDQKQLEQMKLKQINDIKKIDKSKMFSKDKKNKITFFDKILIILGYGRK